MRSEVIVFLAIGVLLAPSAGLTQEADLVSETSERRFKSGPRAPGACSAGFTTAPWTFAQI